MGFERSCRQHKFDLQHVKVTFNWVGLQTELVRLVGWKPKCGRSENRSVQAKSAENQSVVGL
eukprot:2668466-Amphidinium_carterae.1